MSHKLNVALLWGVVGYLACYLTAYLLGFPLLRYLPIDHAWTFAPPEGAISMGYFGLLLYGITGGLLALFIALAMPARRLAASLSHSAWAIVIVAGFGLVAAFVKESMHWIF